MTHGLQQGSSDSWAPFCMHRIVTPSTNLGEMACLLKGRNQSHPTTLRIESIEPAKVTGADEHQQQYLDPHVIWKVSKIANKGLVAGCMLQ
ncbi:unnamed protein product [Larinioides sclopetarius]|uniref:Uncharacterized protein n=1 Tax=Larinioides sclopetarius TaxID=280406 RepID=A0AAV2AF87_9ARAC